MEVKKPLSYSNGYTVIKFSVKLYYIDGWSVYYIYRGTLMVAHELAVRTFQANDILLRPDEGKTKYFI